jgi:hypothetical protein
MQNELIWIKNIKINIMGFVGELMDGVKGIAGYYTLGLIIFLSLFIFILIRTIRIPKAVLIQHKTSILENEFEENSIDKGKK